MEHPHATSYITYKLPKTTNPLIYSSTLISRSALGVWSYHTNPPPEIVAHKIHTTQCMLKALTVSEIINEKTEVEGKIDTFKQKMST